MVHPKPRKPYRKPVRPAPPAPPSSRPFGMGAMTLVAIGTASLGLLMTRCDGDAPPPPELQPIDAQRGVYSSLADCEADWGVEQDRCEPDPADSGATADFNPDGYTGNQAAGGGGGGGGASHGGAGQGGRRYFGPYYTRSGTVYEFDGRLSTLQAEPAHMLRVQQQRIAPAEIYTRAGRYGTTGAHAQAGAAKLAGARAVARGGFGARVGSGGG